jgi:hypothetical protein
MAAEPSMIKIEVDKQMTSFPDQNSNLLAGVLKERMRLVTKTKSAIVDKTCRTIISPNPEGPSE